MDKSCFMKRWALVILGVFLAIGFVVYLVFLPANEVSGLLISPLVKVDSAKVLKVVEVWRPDLSKKRGIAINLEAGQALAVELVSEKLIAVKEPFEKRPIASLTKIMTAMVALDLEKPGTGLTVPQMLNGEDESVMGLKSEERLTLEDLLYGLMLVSANDAAEAIAFNLGGGRREVFVRLMNEKARALGLDKTHFADPSGISPQSVSSAYDLLVLTNYALTNYPKIREIVKTVEWEIPANKDHGYYYLVNQLGLEKTYPGIEGVKAGYTDEAGLVLVSLARQGDKEILAVILNSVSPPNDVRAIYEYGFNR